MSAAKSGSLLRLLGAAFGLAVIIGGTIGVGILRTPGEVAAHLHTPWLILFAWVLGGCYSLLGALSVIELGAGLPNAGGFYTYVRRAFGVRAGFAIGWCDWLGQLTAVAYAALTLSEYTAQLLPALTPHTTALAVGAILAFALLHASGLRISAGFQQWTSLLKAIAFLALVAACFALVRPAQTVSPVAPQALTLAGLVLAAQAIFYTYDGWYSAIYFTEEDRAPERNLRRAMVIGVLSISAIYVLINAAFLYVLPAEELATSKLAAASAATRIFGARGGMFIVVLSLISIPPLMNAVLMMGTRILFALSRDGYVPRELSAVSASGTPQPAMLMSCAVAIIMVVTGTASLLLAIAGFFYVVNYSAAYLCVLILRRTEPFLPRPYRVWAFPYSTVAVLAISLAFLIGAVIADLRNSLYALALLALSEPVRLAFRR